MEEQQVTRVKRITVLDFYDAQSRINSNSLKATQGSQLKLINMKQYYSGNSPGNRVIVIALLSDLRI